MTVEYCDRCREGLKRLEGKFTQQQLDDGERENIRANHLALLPDSIIKGKLTFEEAESILAEYNQVTGATLTWEQLVTTELS